MTGAPPPAAAGELLVRKYGGSSLASPAHLAAVAREVAAAQAAGTPQVVVVSAMGEATNRWLERACEVCPAPPGRELDMLLSVGERVTSALMAMAIHQAGGRAESFTGSQAGIITSDHHLCAEISEVRPHRLEEALGRGQVAVVAGFQGVSHRLQVTTLGRGGSDTTAVALAHALGAARCVLFSDVDGVYRADPRHCPGAGRLERVSWAFLAALSRAGAQVVAPEASGWAARTRTRLVACRSGAAVASGTQVGPPQEAPGGAWAVVAAPDVVRVARRPGGLPAAAAFRRLGARPLATGEAAMWLSLAGVPGRAAQPVVARAAELGFEARPDAWVSCVYEPGAPPPAAWLGAGTSPAGGLGVHREDGLCAWSVPRARAYEIAGELHAELAGSAGPAASAAPPSPMASSRRAATSMASSR